MLRVFDGSKGYALVVVLGVTLIITALSLSIIRSQSAFSSNLAIARRDLARSVLIQNTRAQLGLQMSGKWRSSAGVRLDRDFSVDESKETLKVRWKARTGSVHRPLQGSYAKGPTLLDPDENLPLTGYQKFALEPAGGDLILPPSHSGVTFELSGAQERYRALYSGAFPYALSAPQGSVVADSVKSFSNHTYDESKEMPVDTGVPAWVMAEGLLHVDNFPNGRALSTVGPISVKGGAVAYRVNPSRDNIAQELAQATIKAASDISQNALDKTEAFVGHVLSPVGFVSLLTGSGSLWTLGSAQQATMVPFIPFPTWQSGTLKVIMLHGPWPPDIRPGHDDELPRKLRNLVDRESKLLQERLAKRARDAELLTLLQKEPNSPQRPLWEQERARLRKEITEIEAQRGAVANEISYLKEVIERGQGQGIKGVAPRHSGKFLTVGWSYLFILQQGVELLAQFYTPDGKWEVVLSKLVYPVRLFHLGGRDPEWYFPDGEPKISDGHQQRRPSYVPSNSLSLLGTMTVPVGRTLRINENTQIRGDLWLQKGSTLHIGGNLEVRPPDTWTDRFGKEVIVLDPGFPNGRLMMEEGSSLIVDGDLNCLGGIPEVGSILTVGPLGRVHPISSAIITRGNLSTRHGIHPATSVEELMAYAKRGNADYAPAHRVAAYLAPLFANLSRILGPFESRDCYFADYNSNFNFIVVKGFLVPLPVPLPSGNCMKPIFEGLTWVSSAQLNLRLGPYFYPQSAYWLLGRGVTPVLIKTSPDVMMRLLDPLRNLPDLRDMDLNPIVRSAIGDLIETGLVMTAKTFFIKAVGGIVGSKKPGSLACLSWDSPKLKPAKQVEKFMLEFLKKFGTRLSKSIKQILEAVRSQARRHYVGTPQTFSKELPGLYVHCGKNARIGTSPSSSILASGFFVARGDLTFNTRRTVGTGISLLGDIKANEFLYYPFYSGASLYNPLKPKDYKTPGGLPSSVLPSDELKDMMEVGLPINRGNPIDLQAKGGRILFEGWTP